MNYIREIRKSKNMTMTAVAKEIGCSCPYLYDVEMGNRKPSQLTLQKLSECLGVPIQSMYIYEKKVV